MGNVSWDGTGQINMSHGQP